MIVGVERHDEQPVVEQLQRLRRSPNCPDQRQRSRDIPVCHGTIAVAFLEKRNCCSARWQYSLSSMACDVHADHHRDVIHYRHFAPSEML